MTEQPTPNKLTLLQIIGSTLSAAIGIQSNKNRERDFNANSAHSFIIAGIIGTILFITALIWIVRLVLSKG